MSASVIEHLAYSVTEAAEALRVSPGTVRNLIRDGALKTVRLRDRVVIPKENLEALLKRQ